MYSSYSFSTSILDGAQWSGSHPGRALAPGKGPRYPLYRRLGGPQSRSGHKRLEEKSFRLCRGSNLDRPGVQPVARHYTDWATRLTTCFYTYLQWGLTCLVRNFTFIVAGQNMRAAWDVAEVCEGRPSVQQRKQRTGYSCPQQKFAFKKRQIV
jgi:hypothetical protein